MQKMQYSIRLLEQVIGNSAITYQPASSQTKTLHDLKITRCLSPAITYLVQLTPILLLLFINAYTDLGLSLKVTSTI